MSRVAPPSGEPLPATARKSFTPAQRLEVYSRYDGNCTACGKPLGESWDIDHEIPLALGGKHLLSNWQPLHSIPCHQTKTRNDRRTIAKTKRLIAKLLVPRKPTRLRGRGFSRLLKRKFNGTVEKRK